MNLNQLYYFQKVAQLQHYHQAAKELNISQPSLSRSIANLEEELGVSLFQKNGRNIELTKYGSIFLASGNTYPISMCPLELPAKDFILFSAILISSIIRLTCSKSYIPRLVRSFLNQQENHEITFSLSQEITKNLIADLKNEKYDVVFGSLVADEPEVEFVPVVNQEMVIITPPEHPLKYKKKLVLEDLLDYPVIGYDKTSGLGRFTNSIYKQNHIKPSIAFESSDENAIASLVAEDFGIGFVAHVESLQAYDVEILHLSNVKPYHTVYMAYLKNMPMIPAVRKFIEFTKETIDIFY